MKPMSRMLCRKSSATPSLGVPDAMSGVVPSSMDIVGKGTADSCNRSIPSIMAIHDGLHKNASVHVASVYINL